MRDWYKEEFIDIVEKEEYVLPFFSNYIKDKQEKIVFELKVEQIADDVIHKLDESIVADFDYHDESLEAIEAIIDNAFLHSPPEEMSSDLIEELVTDLGAYFGQTLIKTLGGEWRFRDDLINSSIYFGSVESECFPFHKMAKRLLYGKDESLLSFYISLLKLLGVEE